MPILEMSRAINSVVKASAYISTKDNLSFWHKIRSPALTRPMVITVMAVLLWRVAVTPVLVSISVQGVLCGRMQQLN